ncbi:OsmC family protein, partial [Tepidibacter formicigenes]
IDLEGDLDSEGFKGSEDVRPGFQNVRAKFHIKANASKEKIEKLVKNIERFCPVGDSLENGVNLTTEYVLE